MTKRDYLKRYMLIIEVLRKKASTFSEINSFLIDNEIEISQRTFQRDKEEIESLWGIEIKFNKKEEKYEINEEYADEKFDRIVESFNLVNVLNQSQSVSKYIYLEQRRHKGSEYFQGILHAIQNELIITFQLNSYWNEPSFRRCIPKGIKEAQNRWYLIAFDLDRNDFRNYGLDRISNFEITSGKMKVPDININEQYKHAFGIENSLNSTTIILEFDISQINYLKSLPLHHSQNIIIENKSTFRVAYFMHPTHDFIMEILRFGNWCEVIEPIDLRNKLKEITNNMKKKYKKKNE
jgi:proteasome accessory factor B